ncbi:DNA-methyltransferase, partial [Planktothrix agardhii]|uniref:DNA-methyltransferase n=1 Tax=Planktothrix agardhii TaxID=1160 RepID=UPI00333F56C4
RGLTEEQWKKYAIADNTASDFSTWDFEILEELAQEVDYSEFFPDDKLNELLEQLGKGESFGVGEQGEENEEEIAELLDKVDEIESRVKLGDIWQLGRHRICAGDSTIEKNVRALLGDNRCQMCWTDPPYNVNYDPEARVSSFSQERLANPIGKIANDHMGDDEFFLFLLNAYSGINIALEEGCPIYISHADTMGHHFRNAFMSQPWKLQSCLIWKKTVLVFGRADYHWMHEPILYGWKEGAAHRWVGDRKQTSILEFATDHYDKENCDTDGYVHSCQKPTTLISYCIENSSNKGDRIYDPFLGSGSTLIASEKTGRETFGFELSEQYCEIILQRFSKLTGIEPKLIGRISN